MLLTKYLYKWLVVVISVSIIFLILGKITKNKYIGINKYLLTRDTSSYPQSVSSLPPLVNFLDQYE